VVTRKPGDQVTAGDPVLILHYDDERKLPDAMKTAAAAIAIAETPPARSPLVMAWVHAGGESSDV
jgi:thymidine phosphorylase